MEGRSLRVVAIEQVLNSDEGKKVYDPVLDGLRSSVRYDQKYYDKIVASLLPLLEKLTSGKTAQLISPNYTDMSDPRPIFDWQQVIRKRAWFISALMRCPIRKSRRRWVIRCLPIWSPWRGIYTNLA